MGCKCGCGGQGSNIGSLTATYAFPYGGSDAWGGHILPNACCGKTAVYAAPSAINYAAWPWYKSNSITYNSVFVPRCCR